MSTLYARYMTHIVSHWTIIGSVLAVVLTSGCETAQKVGTQIDNAISSATGASTSVDSATKSAAEYHGRRARITVLRFTDATGGKWRYTTSIGEGMTRKLVASMVETNRFRVLDRRKMTDQVKEIEFGRSGLVDPATAARLGRTVGARLVVTAAVTDFDEQIGGTASKNRNVSGLQRALGALSSNTNRAYMAVNLEVIDVETSEIVASQQVEGKVTDVNVAGTLGVNTPLGDVRSWDQYPRGKALQEVIDHAVEFLASEIPDDYFTEAAPRKQPVASDNMALEMQRILKNLGYYNGAVDGMLGAQSYEAIKKFQNDYGLNVTGALDPSTREKLSSLAQ